MNILQEAPPLSSQTNSSSPATLLVFTLAGQRYALSLRSVACVVPVVAVTPIPQAPAMMLGVINLRGQIVPVVSTRKWFGLPDRPVQLSDRLIIVQFAERKMVLLVDHVIGVEAMTAADETLGDDLLPGVGSPVSVIKRGDGLILLHQLDDLEKMTYWARLT